MIEDRQFNHNKSHKFIINNRKSGSITGVKDVIAFDVSEVLLETEQGMLHIKGQNLHINKLSIEKGEIEIDGCVDSFLYSEVSSFSKKGKSFLSRLFK